jgi:hypothetical protein
MVLPRHPDGCTRTLGSSRTLNSSRTIYHYVRTDATLNSSKLLDIGDVRTDALTDERLDGISHRSDGCKGTELTVLNSTQSLLEAHN